LREIDGGREVKEESRKERGEEVGNGEADRVESEEERQSATKF
jgi:hypothetical protein